MSAEKQVNTATESVANIDNYEIGDKVIARFTNSNRIIEFKGCVEGVTKNYFKVASLEDGVQGSPAGRVFHVSRLGSRTYSANNSIQGKMCACGHGLYSHDDQAVCRALVDGRKSCQCMQYGAA